MLRRRLRVDYPIPVAFTAQIQLAGACTSSCTLPVVDCGVTELPDAPVPVTAGVEPGEPPVGTTKTSNAGPDAGAGVHW